MIIRDDVAAADTAAKPLNHCHIGRLRGPAGSITRGRFPTSSATVRAPHRQTTEAEPDCDEIRAEMQALRQDVESMRAEVEHLSDVVAAHRADDASAHRRLEEAAAGVLRQPAAGPDQCAIARVDAAASDLLHAAAGRSDLHRDWHRTDAAVADFIFALAKRDNAECETCRADRAAANRLRRDGRLARLENERATMRKLRARRWWRWALH